MNTAKVIGRTKDGETVYEGPHPSLLRVVWRYILSAGPSGKVIPMEVEESEIMDRLPETPICRHCQGEHHSSECRILGGQNSRK